MSAGARDTRQGLFWDWRTTRSSQPKRNGLFLVPFYWLGSPIFGDCSPESFPTPGPDGCLEPYARRLTSIGRLIAFKTFWKIPSIRSLCSYLSACIANSSGPFIYHAPPPNTRLILLSLESRPLGELLGCSWMKHGKQPLTWLVLFGVCVIVSPIVDLGALPESLTIACACRCAPPQRSPLCTPKDPRSICTFWASPFQVVCFCQSFFLFPVCNCHLFPPPSPCFSL